MLFLYNFSKILWRIRKLAEKVVVSGTGLFPLLFRVSDQSIVATLKEDPGFWLVTVRLHYVCVKRVVSITQAFKAWEKGKPYQLRWLKDKKVSACWVQSSISVTSRLTNKTLLGRTYAILAGVESLGDVSLCTPHYQEIFRMVNKGRARMSCGVLAPKQEAQFHFLPWP